jgi:hypothetical protein
LTYTCYIKEEEEEESRRLQNKHQQQQQEEISSNAYKLLSKDKRPVQVAIILNLRKEEEVTEMYREYWKLNKLHVLNSIYKETHDILDSFLKLYK